MKEPIRLTNKTAIALRKNAQKVRTAYFAAQIILSTLLGVGAVALGFFWLPASALMIVLIALIDCALAIASRSRYLLLLGQAICTEAAAREISAGKSETMRREQAITDLMRMKADVQSTNEKAPGAQPFFEEKDEEAPEAEELQDEAAYGRAQAEPRRRRKQANLQLIKSSEAK